MELQTLRLMRDEVARGTRASVAAARIHLDLDRDRDGGSGAYVDAFLDASHRQDAAHMVGQLEAACAALGLGRSVDDVLFPALRRIGVWWQSEVCNVDTERLATEVARTWLDTVAASAPAPADAAPIVLACGPRDLHTVGLEALAALLRHQRQPCRVLGAKTSVRSIATAVHAGRASAVVIVSHLRAHRPAATQSLRSAHRLGPDLFYAGEAFGSARLRRNVPGTFLGTSLREACTTIVTTREGPRH